MNEMNALGLRSEYPFCYNYCCQQRAFHVACGRGIMLLNPAKEVGI